MRVRFPALAVLLGALALAGCPGFLRPDAPQAPAHPDAEVSGRMGRWVTPEPSGVSSYTFIAGANQPDTSLRLDFPASSEQGWPLPDGGESGRHRLAETQAGSGAFEDAQVGRFVVACDAGLGAGELRITSSRHTGRSGDATQDEVHGEADVRFDWVWADGGLESRWVRLRY